MQASTARRRQAPRAPDRSLFDPYIPAFQGHLSSEGMRACSIANYPGPAKHFLVWLHQQGIQIQGVDGDVIRCFLEHECHCPRPHGERYQCTTNHSPHLKGRILRFVAFLEQQRHIHNPVDQGAALERVDAFCAFLASQARAAGTVAHYRRNCSHFVYWLCQQRIAMEAIDEDTLRQFDRHDCVCAGTFTLGAQRDAHGAGAKRVARFVRYLSATDGSVAATAEQPDDQAGTLAAFRAWMRRHRGTGEQTLAKYTHQLRRVLPQLGPDPARYDAASVNHLILQRASAASPLAAQAATGALRMYFRYLAATGQCAPSLAGAVPRVPRWRLATLPRYVLQEEVERVIASCDLTTARGMRDHAILLLLARLALRAGDIVHLRLADVDWNNALIRVAGKSAREVALPLPQDVGDAIAAYVERARPRVPAAHVFLRSLAPFEPLAHGSVVTGIVSAALNRAGITNATLRGAYLLRHSAATHLLRSGSTLEAVGALLRHRSMDTTTIYAKVDTRMLAHIVQPWIGGVTCR